MIQYLQDAPGRTVLINGENLLFFSGYSYLGMSHLPAFVEKAKAAIDQFGLLYPSSRSSNTQFALYTEMEQLLSSVTEQADTVLFSSGYLAGRAVAELFASRSQVYMPPGTHPAIRQDAQVLRSDWQSHLLQLANTYREIVLLVDSVYPLSATVNDFHFLHQLPVDCKLTCIIDDSHGIGIIGKNGEGISGSLPKLPNVSYIFTYSLSKAFHINGGAVSCSGEVAAQLRRSPFYTASTPIAPFLVSAFLHSQELYKSQRELLLQNINTLTRLIENCSDIKVNEQLPIAILPTTFYQRAFDPYKIVISSFPYPDPSGTLINRAVVSALHTTNDLQLLANAIAGLSTLQSGAI